MTATCQHGAAWWRGDCPGCLLEKRMVAQPECNLTTWRVRGERPLRFFYDGPLGELHWSNFFTVTDFLRYLARLE